MWIGISGSWALADDDRALHRGVNLAVVRVRAGRSELGRLGGATAADRATVRAAVERDGMRGAVVVRPGDKATDGHVGGRRIEGEVLDVDRAAAAGGVARNGRRGRAAGGRCRCT